VSGPTSWDGYVAAITSDACVTAQEREGEAVAIALPTRPSLYN
jgi:myo-inositol 2-dehydrogenase/D-chiro-inositol 1-dehydrogenase